MKQEQSRDLSVVRHSAAHLLAQAITELYPDVQLTLGPATQDGFFYDFLLPHTLKEEALPLITERMRDIVQKNYPISHKEITKKEACELYKNNPFKLELIEGIPGDTVGLSVQGSFFDLCKGGHVASTGEIAAFKLTGLSGSYWRADKTKQALQRIQGIAFYSVQELEEYEKQREEALLYDHRRLGKQLDLFSFHDEGVGFPFFHPKGQKVLNVLYNYMRTLHEEHGYQEVTTPTMLSDELWKRSGHYAHYKKHMYFTNVDEQSYAIRPMNCPGAILIYQQRPRSYKELPLKLAEFGHVHRHELSGVLHGLFRVRAFTIDDGHFFCTVDQIEEQIKTTLSLAMKVLKRCNFERINLAISTKPDNAMGDDATWSKATQALKNALNSINHPYEILEGEGAFYGPKIEITIQDSMKRSWQCGTIQVDFFQPENFDLTYVAATGKQERPVIIHQAIFGSLERFFAILLEHYKGNLPFWLAPVQVKLLPITDQQYEYARTVMARLKHDGLRCEINENADPIGAKIKSAQLEKVPYMLVIGKKEAEAGTVSLRTLDGIQTAGLTIEQLLEKAHELLA